MVKPVLLHACETRKVSEKDIMIKTLSSFQYQSFKTTHGDPKERERSNVGKNNERERYAAGWRSIQSGLTYDFEGFKLCSVENNDRR